MKEERFHLDIVCAVSGKKRLVLNMHDCSAKNARESKKRQTTSARSIHHLQSLESILKSPTRNVVSTLGSNDNADEYRVQETSDVSLPISRCQLLSTCEMFIEERGQN